MTENGLYVIYALGLQLVAETFAVALFKMLGDTAMDPLFKEICRYILQDKSRHMGFGMLSLPGVIGALSERERIELEDFTHWARVRTLTGLFPGELYRDMGFTGAEIQAIQTLRRGRAAGHDNTVFRTTFKRDRTPRCPRTSHAWGSSPRGSRPSSNPSASPSSPAEAKIEGREAPQAAEKGPDATRRPTAAGEAYFLHVEPAAEGANKADGPFSAACYAASATLERGRSRSSTSFMKSVSRSASSVLSRFCRSSSASAPLNCSRSRSPNRSVVSERLRSCSTS
jgi:hypothetical protein